MREKYNNHQNDNFFFNQGCALTTELTIGSPTTLSIQCKKKNFQVTLQLSKNVFA